MSVTLTAVQESTVRQGHAEGQSLRWCAKQAGVDPSDLSRWSKRAGLLWTSRGADRASVAVRDRTANARADLAAKLVSDAVSIRERFWDEHTVIVSTPNGPERVVLDLPDAKATSDYANAIGKLVASSENLDRMSAGRNAEHAKSAIRRLHNGLGAALDALEQVDGAGAGD